MAIEAFTGAQIFLGNYNVSGKHNQVSVDHSIELLDSTVFGMTTRANTPGLLTWKVSGSGFWEVGAADPAYGDQTFFNRLGAAEVGLTVAPKAVENGPAVFLKALQPSYSFLGTVGELAPFSLEHDPSSYGCKGVIGLPPTQQAAGGNGAGYQFSAPLGATQRLVAMMHVVQFNGTTMTMKIQSDDNGGFTSATDRITFTAATGLTWEWKELLGPVATDDRYRALWTFTGTTFTAIVAFGIVNYAV